MVTKRQRAALRRSDAHPKAVAAAARDAQRFGDASKAAALYRAILETHPGSSVSVEALNFLMLHREPSRYDDSESRNEWAMPPPRRGTRESHGLIGSEKRSRDLI
jgi:hypothetical protein